MSGAVNPLAFIGAGMASGDPGGQLARMGQLQTVGQQNLLNQRLFMMQQQEAERKAKQNQALTAIAPGVAKEMFPTQPNMQAMLAMHPALLQEAMKQRMAQAQAAPGAGLLTREEIGKEFDLSEFTPESVQAVMAGGTTAGGYDPGGFVPRTGGVVDFKDASALRKEYTKASAPWQESSRAFERIMATQPTGAGDIALLTSYMKVLDPGSTVREGEFATAEQAGGVPDYVRNVYNKLITGERLSPEQRTNFKSQAAAFLENRRKEQENVQRRYGYIARRRNMDVPETVPDFMGDFAAPDWKKTMGILPPVLGGGVGRTIAPSPAETDALMEKYGPKRSILPR